MSEPDEGIFDLLREQLRQEVEKVTIKDIEKKVQGDGFVTWRLRTGAIHTIYDGRETAS